MTPLPPQADKGMAFSTSARLSVGTNVAVMVIAAAALTVLVNWIANTHYYHSDWSTFGRYSLSERTRKIVQSVSKPIHITIVYDSKDPEKDREKYQPRLYDLAQEIRAVAGNVTIEDISTPAEKKKLADRLAEEQANRAGGHKDLVGLFNSKQEELKKELAAEQQRLIQLAGKGDTWLSSFAQVRVAFSLMEELKKSLDKTAAEIRKQSSGPMVAYDKQKEAIERLLEGSAEQGQTGARKQIETIQRLIGELARLADKAKAGDDGGLEAQTKELAGKVDAEMNGLLTSLRARPTTAPATQAGQPFRQAAESFKKLAGLFRQHATNLSAFAKDRSAVRGMAYWYLGIVQGGQEVEAPLDALSADMAGRLLRQAAELEAQAPDLSEQAIERYRPQLLQLAAELRETAQMLFASTARMLAAFKTVDPASAQFLAVGEKYLKSADPDKPETSISGKLDQLTQQIKAVERLAGGDLAGKLEQENLVIVEVDKGEPRVLTFDEVWPVRAVPEELAGRSEKKIEVTRTFNGDSAVASAILSASRKPIAEVVFVHSSRMGGHPMMGPRMEEGELPYRRLTVLRERLSQANLKVGDWNVAESPTPPAPLIPRRESSAPALERLCRQMVRLLGGDWPDKDPRRVYVVLPLPMPGRTGQEEDPVEAVAEAIRADGRALFLVGWPEVGSRWNEYLEKNWGLNVESSFRLMQGVPEDDKYGIDPLRLTWMTLNSFNPDHPAGRTLVARRVLLVNACPIKTVPAKDLLEVYARELLLSEQQKADAAKLVEAAKEARKTLDEERTRRRQELDPDDPDDLRALDRDYDAKVEAADDKLDADLRALLTAGQLAKLPPRVVLSVSKNDPTIWATRYAEDAYEEMLQSESGLITLHESDRKPPLNVMVEASRLAGPAWDGSPSGERPNRIMVFASGLSVSDMFLKMRVPRTGKESWKFDPPPEANADIIVNAVYSLADQEQWIAAGPVMVPPITVPQERLLTIQILVVGVLPLVLLASGGVVAWRRRRAR